MVDFAGWSMPVLYSSIVAEHVATRNAAGLFDVSHMGRLRFKGNRVADFLDRIVTRQVTDMQPGQIRYSLVTNYAGGVLDDVLIYRLPDLAGSPQFFMVVNASNRQKIVDWIDRHLAGSGDLSCVDATFETAMIAVQGPLAIELVQYLLGFELRSIKYYHAIQTEIGGEEVIISRTGYTGEDGLELIVSAGAAERLWTKIIERGAEQGVMAAGLGARDTLRLEAAMPLYGHELLESITPLEAGLDFAVNLQDRQFPGSEPLRKIKGEGLRRLRIGLQLSGKRVPREHYSIFVNGQPAGEVTSGTFSPTLQRPIAMGYLPPQLGEIGTEVTVDIRGSREPARVVRMPFYRRAASN